MRRFLSVAFICLFVSCSSKDHIPSGIIPKNEMQKIFWDMIQANQFSKQFVLKDSAKKNVNLETMKLYEQVFQLHHITKDEFQKSNQFYINHPDILKVMFDSISVQGNRQMHDAFRQKAIP